jgi:hypothetical protein
MSKECCSKELVLEFTEGPITACLVWRTKGEPNISPASDREKHIKCSGMSLASSICLKRDASGTGYLWTSKGLHSDHLGGIPIPITRPTAALFALDLDHLGTQ